MKDTPRNILQKTGYTIYADDDVLAAAPVGKVQPVEVFTVGRFISDNDLEKEYTKRGLVPADLASLSAVCREHKFLATHWKDANGKWCCATFDRWGGERDVHVGRFDCGWHGPLSFAGVPQGSSALESSEKLSDALPLTLIINGIEYRRV